MNSRNEKASGLMGDLESIKALLEEDDLGAIPEALTGNDAGHSLPPELLVDDPIAASDEPADAVSEASEQDDIPLLQESLATFDPKTGVSAPAESGAAAPDAPHIQIETVPGAELSADELADLADLEREAQSVATAPAQPAATAPAAGSLDALLGDEFHSATAEVMSRARALINQHANQWSPQQTDELADALRVRIDGAVHQWIQTSLAAHSGELQQRLLNAVRDELARHLEAFESAPD